MLDAVRRRELPAMGKRTVDHAKAPSLDAVRLSVQVEIQHGRKLKGTPPCQRHVLQTRVYCDC